MEFTCHLNQADLQDYIRTVFGTGYSATRVSKMHGGAQKVVYKIECIETPTAKAVYHAHLTVQRVGFLND